MFTLHRHSLKTLFLCTVLLSSVAPAMAQGTLVNGTNWNTFYDSLDVMKAELPHAKREALTSDVNAIDQYFFGQYQDGVYTQLGDLKFRESISGKSAKQIHELAKKLITKN
jgi:hypothetical protein